MEPFKAAVVEQAIRIYGQSVVKLDPLDSVFNNKALLARVKAAMQEFGRVILLLPCSREAESVRILENQSRVTYKGMDWNEYFVRQPSNHRLAKQVMYNQKQTPTETAADILDRLDRRSPDVFLLGPVGAGKTTVGKLLSSWLSIPQLTLDGIRRKYYAEKGYLKSEEVRIRKSLGDEAVLDYWKKFDVHAITRALEDHPGHIIDFGAGQTVFENEGDLERIVALFAPYPNIFLLLPSPDPVVSVTILKQRQRHRTSIGGVAIERYLVSHPANQVFATTIVYTAGKTPSQICDEILHSI